MIGLNEIHSVLKNLLPCVGYVAEIVFVDSGSTDGTVEAVEGIDKARVFTEVWPDNFSVQRNRALSHARYDWILVKDCDEAFELDLLNNLEMMCHAKMFGKVDGFGFQRRNYIDGKLHNWWHTGWTTRLFRNSTAIRYQGKMHESLIGCERVFNTNLWIHHDKSLADQQRDDERYWDMGQELPEGDVKKVNGEWQYPWRIL